ncbi:hypothetical protein OA492_02670 [Pelagibacteraceae bacterium]|nr:hypothetical protein [Pelagibacteraceae bacterium]
MTNKHNIQMRDAFIKKVYLRMKKNKDIVFISNEQGAASLDILRKDFPKRFINAGISEQNIITLASGMSSLGKKVIVYSIASFITLRCFEQIKIDLCVMKQPVTIVGVGASYSYSADGPTHHATEDISIMRALSNIQIFSPSDSFQAEQLVDTCINSVKPTYVRLDRQTFPVLQNKKLNILNGFNLLSESKNFAIISTGSMVHNSNELVLNLKKKNFKVALIDLFKIKPINTSLLKQIKNFKKIITIEENFINGGIGSVISELVSDNNLDIKLLRLGLNENKLYNYGSRQYLHSVHKLDSENLLKSSIKFLDE